MLQGQIEEKLVLPNGVNFGANLGANFEANCYQSGLINVKGGASMSGTPNSEVSKRTSVNFAFYKRNQMQKHVLTMLFMKIVPISGNT